MNKYFNPFQSLELRFPEQYREEVEKYTRTGSAAGTSPSRAPFPRMVDLWWLAVCVAARRGKREPVREKMHKFMEGSILASDPWRIEQLCLMVIGFTGSTEILRTPPDVVQLANELAAAGLPTVLEWLQSGRSEPIFNVSEQIVEAAGGGA